jgi:hypothetical protein
MPPSLPPLVEAFLIVEQPRQRLGHWSIALSALDDGRAPPLATIAAYYDPAADQALLALRYDELALGPTRLSFVVEVALLAEIGMIQPAELSEGDRRRFLGERLARCTMHVADQRSVVGALTELVRRIRESRPKAAHASLVPRRPPSDPPPDPSAKSTRDLLRIDPPRQRMDTVQMSPAESLRLAAQTTDPPEIDEQPTGIIYARYLRSGRWVPVRIGALSLKGAALMSGVLPRLHDHVDIALSFGTYRALVRGPVRKVSTREETALTGTATFSVVFELDDNARRQLTALLTAARAEKITIKPPPPRTTRRFPVDWPICLGTPRGAVRGEALDVSRDGMFVRPAVPITLDSTVSFSITLDDDSQPVSGRARIVRQILDSEARACGLQPGYGLNILDMVAGDRERWQQFCARIEKRAEKRVLVGAAPERLTELQSTLAACGYAVSGGADPGALVQLAGAERPVDAVLLDGGWLARGKAETWIESLFSSRNVPCITMHGDAQRGRIAIDKLLSVV